MNILVLNAGGGSQKCSLFRLPPSFSPPSPAREPDWELTLDSTDPAQPKDELTVSIAAAGRGMEPDTVARTTSAEERTRFMLRKLKALVAGEAASDPLEPDAVAHRVVHGGGTHENAVVIDPQVEAAISEFGAMAPLHNRHALTGLGVAREHFGHSVPQVAVFDTAFHHTIPAAASVYPGPYAWAQTGIRRYGFHGTSFRWASRRAAELLDRRDDPELRLIIAHLGSGCSLCATIGGRSIDTTMGYTPLDGIAMCQRSGAVDPGIIFRLLRDGQSIDGLEKTLNSESGLKGLSGLVGDTRVILPAVADGNHRAVLAWEVFLHRLCAGFGQMLASLGQAPDAFVFTDAIGESEPLLREAVARQFAFLRVGIDPAANRSSATDADIATPDSGVRVLVIKSREAWQIALETHSLLSTVMSRAT